jgi:hypothetical protein
MANHLSYEVLNRLVEGRASVLEEARAQRHLARCGRCRSEREWLERIRGLPTSGLRHRLERLERMDDSPSAFQINSAWLTGRASY